MRKFWIISLIFILIGTLAIFASAQEAHPHEADHCVCGGSAVGVEDHKCQTVTWQPLPAGTTDLSKLSSGNYYLTGDVTVKSAGAWKAKQQIRLCLNGYDITTTATAAFGYIYADASVTFCECSGKQAADGTWHWDGSVSAKASDARSYGGVLNLTANSAAYVYGGNFYAGSGSKNGGIFNVNHDFYADVGASSNTDASLHTSLNIYNGNFVGGTVSINGGIINVWHNADVFIYGGTFRDGTAAKGGNIYLGTGDYILKNCRLTGGTATNEAGNLYATGVKSLVIENVYIAGGKAETNYNNIRVKAGVLDLSKNQVIPAQTDVCRVIRGGKYLESDYMSLQEGFDKAKDTANLHVRMLRDGVSDATVNGTVWLDLAGFDLEGITVVGTLYGMDSTTDGYDGARCGTLTPAAGVPQLHDKTDAARLGAVRRYLSVAAGEGWSFHRFYVGITSVVVQPGHSGLGYRATFAGDEQVKNALSASGGFGMAVGVSPLPESLAGNVYRSQSRALFTAGEPFTRKMVIQNILDPQSNFNGQRAGMDVYARAYVRLADGTVIISEQQSRNLRQMVETVNNTWNTYTDAQKAAMDQMIKAHELYTSGWNVANIHHHDTALWQPWDGTWESGGHYYLTESASLSRITIPEGQTLDICLNGCQLYGSATTTRLFNIKGTLNIHDHCDDQGEYAGAVITGYNGICMAPVFYVYERAVFNLCGGTLTQVEGNAVTRAGIGMIGNGNENKDYATMNMWNGVITGGTVAPAWDSATGNFKSNLHNGVGGNLGLVSYAVFNMYGGTISDGKTTAGTTDGTTPITNLNGCGGNIASTSSGIINIYDGLITGGEATGLNDNSGLGGNIYCPGGELNIYGGTVENGTSQGGLGGNIYAACAVTVTGGTVTGGICQPLTVDGKAQPGSGLGGGIYATKTVTLSGTPYIYENQEQDLFLGELAEMDGTDLSPSAQIGVSGSIRGRVSTDPAMADRFVSNDADFAVTAINGGVALVPRDLDTGKVESPVTAFSVGYSSVDITPVEEGLTMSSYGNPNGRKSAGLGYRLYATTVAITDEQNNSILMVTLDLQNTPEDYLAVVTQRISQVTGVPAGNIYLSATHTHNVPTVSTSTAKNARYRLQLIDALVRGALTALEDRAPATMQTGSFDTDGMNFSRHYYYYDENGAYTDAEGNRISYFGDQFGQKPAGVTAYRVREGDETMHMLAFTRSGKKPVLVVNWRAHPHRSGGMTSYQINADVIGATREYVQRNSDYLFAYFQGAAGNMNTTSRLSGETYKAGKIKEYGDELGRQLLENGTPVLQSVPTGLVRTKKVVLAANVDHTEDDRYDAAVELNNFYKNNPDLMDTYEEQVAKAAEYGFSGVFHAGRLITKYKLAATRNIELNVFSIGDSIGFYTAPGELWDSFSEEMEVRSPFATTFCIGYSNGNVAYIPYQVTYSSYEYHYCLFTQPETIETMMDIYETGLKEQFGKG